MDGFRKKRFLSRGGAPFAGVFVFYFKPLHFEITQLSLYSYFFYLDKCFKDNHLQNYFLINILSFEIVRCNKYIAFVFPHPVMLTSSSLVWYRYLIKNPDSFQMPIFGRRKMKNREAEFIVFILCILHSSSKVVQRSIQESQISIMGETRPLFNSVHESIGSHIEIDKG